MRSTEEDRSLIKTI